MLSDIRSDVQTQILDILSHIRIVLVQTSHPGNIGASARALKNMGLSQLHLVAPKAFPSEEAEARASNATDILAHAKVFDTLEEALQGCSWVLGTSGRKRKISLPVFSAREAAENITEHFIEHFLESNFQLAGDVALLFGNEQHGLSNEELDCCAGQIIIPTADEYASLNLAQAVQIMAYEILLSLLSLSNLAEHPSEHQHESLASYEALAEFYREFEKTLIYIQFLDPENKGNMMVHMKHLFSRAKITQTELTLLRGMLSSITAKDP